MPSRKTFVGRVLSVTQTHVVMSCADGAISLRAGAVTLEQARCWLRRTVRYSVELDASTQALSDPRFVIGSEYGLVAVTQQLRAVDEAAE